MCSLRQAKPPRPPLDIVGYLAPRVSEQLRVLLPITLYLVFFQLVILQTKILHPVSIAAAMLAVRPRSLAPMPCSERCVAYLSSLS